MTHDRPEIMVSGGNWAGLQAAVNLADAGFKVFVVERTAHLGDFPDPLANVIPPDETPPWMVQPLLKKVMNHRNIETLLLSRIIAFSGRKGDFTVRLDRYPAYSEPSGCAVPEDCRARCPRQVCQECYRGRPDGYYDSLNCEHYVACRCRVCETNCPSEGYESDSLKEEITIHPGAVILADSAVLSDASAVDAFHYREHPDILTQAEFGRLLKRSFIKKQAITRPSNGDLIHDIAWIQCMGSRDTRAGRKTFCSSICCGWTIRMALLASEIQPETGSTVFYTDMRTQDDEAAFHLTCAKPGFRFVRSRIDGLSIDRKSNRIKIGYVDEDQSWKEHESDLAVLASGIDPPSRYLAVFQNAGMKFDPDGFPAMNKWGSLETTIPGVFACGAVRAPESIGRAVSEALAASAEAMAAFAGFRPKIHLPYDTPAEADSNRGLRAGVFICHCRGQLLSAADCDDAIRSIRNHPAVFAADTVDCACSSEFERKLDEAIRLNNLNQVLFAACSRDMLPVISSDRHVMADISPDGFHFVNISDIPRIKETSTRSGELSQRVANALARMESSFCSGHETGNYPEVLIVGGGISGLVAAGQLARHGVSSHIVEKESQLNGPALLPSRPADRLTAESDFLRLKEDAESSTLVKIHLNTEIRQSDRIGRRFETICHSGGRSFPIHHDSVIFATECEETMASAFAGHSGPHVVTLTEMEKKVRLGDELVKSAGTIAFALFSGAREGTRPYCLRICCARAVSLAVQMKEESRDRDIFIVFDQMRSFGRMEAVYAQAREKGIRFAGFRSGSRVDLSEMNDSVFIEFEDRDLGAPVEIKADMVVVPALMTGAHDRNSAEIWGVKHDENGFLQPANHHLYPLDASSEGIFICGSGHTPQFLEELMIQARGAACRAANYCLTRP